MQAITNQEVLALDARLDKTCISMLEKVEACPTLKTLLLLANSLKIIVKFEGNLQVHLPMQQTTNPRLDHSVTPVQKHQL